MRKLLSWFNQSRTTLDLINTKMIISKKASNNTVDESKKLEELARIVENADIEQPPTTCCMSGCANCVYIVWAEALSKKMEGAGPHIAEKILSLVEDPSLKAYLEMELRMRGFKLKE